MRQGRRAIWGTALAAIAIAATGASPAAASRGGCFAAAGSGAKPVAQSSAAIVLARKGKLYGCSYDRERAHLLPGQDEGERILRGSVQVEARNAAYGSMLDSEHHTVTVFSVKLRSGHTWAASDDTGFGDDVDLDDLVLRPNGSIAWQFSYRYAEDDGWTKVMGFDHGGSGSPQFNLYDNDESGSDRDREHRIIRGTLRLSHLGSSWRVAWSRRSEGSISAPIH